MITKILFFQKWHPSVKATYKFVFPQHFSFSCDSYRGTMPAILSQKILSRQHLYKDQQFDLDLWPRVLKFNREHLLSRINHCSKISILLSQNEVFRYWGDSIYKDRGPPPSTEYGTFSRFSNIIMTFQPNTFRFKMYRISLGHNAKFKTRGLSLAIFS